MVKIFYTLLICISLFMCCRYHSLLNIIFLRKKFFLAKYFLRYNANSASIVYSYKIRCMKKILVSCVIILSSAGMWSCKTTVAAKPEAVVVARPAQPGPNYIWIEGDWYVSGGRYVQRPGYWVIPRKSRTWVPGSWHHNNHGWYWQKGHWR